VGKGLFLFRGEDLQQNYTAKRKEEKNSLLRRSFSPTGLNYNFLAIILSTALP
jgi:hypothetical protein